MNDDHPRVVIVDDDLEIRNLLEDYLKTLGYKTTTFPSPIETIEDMHSGLLHQEIEGLSFPIIISDYVMPKMDGITFNEKVHKEFPQIPIILLTAFGTQETTKSATESGIFQVIKKPFDLSDVKSAVSKAEEHLKPRCRNCEGCSKNG